MTSIFKPRGVSCEITLAARRRRKEGVHALVGVTAACSGVGATIIVKDEPAAREAAVAELARGCIQGRGTQLVAAISDGVRVMTETVGTGKVRIGS